MVLSLLLADGVIYRDTPIGLDVQQEKNFMARVQQSLSGLWQFQVDPDGAITVQTLAPEREIRVPLPWQAAFSDLEHYSGYAWYRTRVDLDQQWLNGELLLKFGAGDYWCQVFVNGTLAGEHEGGYTPFTVRI